MERMLIKHLSGSKANQVEEFSLKHHNEIIFGRDLTAAVRYDPDRDDLVGRQHAKIARDPANTDHFFLTDLNSTNGTFMNGQRITGTVPINPGDRVQFGPGGPEFAFDIEPRPTEQMKTTRAVDAGGLGAVPSTRVSTAASSASAELKPTGTVGKATVERMVSQAVAETKRSQRRKFGAIGGVALVLILLLVVGALGGGYWYFTKVSGRTAELEKKTEGISPSDINDKYSKAVVQVFDAWRLLNTAEQLQAYHAWGYPPTGGTPVPLYVQMPSGKIEPILKYKLVGDVDQPIGGRVTGTGFIVTPDGFILTSRDVAAPWMSPYQFDREKYRRPGILFASDYVTILSTNQAPPSDWIPANSEQVRKTNVTTGSKKNKASFAIVTADLLRGTNDVLEVRLPGRDMPILAQLKQPSERQNVAQIKIDMMGDLTKVEQFDNYDGLRKGDSVTILGYPDAAPPQFGMIESKDASNPGTRMRLIPNPTVINTNISNISRDEQTKSGRRVSVMGDVFQLASGQGFGASGAPVFDSQGRVIGMVVLFADDPNEFFAVPSRYFKDFGG
jgi:serine protease Do